MPLEVVNEVINATLEKSVDGKLYKGSVTRRGFNVTSGTIFCYSTSIEGVQRLECKVEVNFMSPLQMGTPMHMSMDASVSEEIQRLLELAEYRVGAALEHVGNVTALLDEYESLNR